MFRCLPLLAQRVTANVEFGCSEIRGNSKKWQFGDLTLFWLNVRVCAWEREREVNLRSLSKFIRGRRRANISSALVITIAKCEPSQFPERCLHIVSRRFPFWEKRWAERIRLNRRNKLWRRRRRNDGEAKIGRNYYEIIKCQYLPKPTYILSFSSQATSPANITPQTLKSYHFISRFLYIKKKKSLILLYA